MSYLRLSKRLFLFVFHFFSIALLLRTLFSPFERLDEGYGQRFDLGRILSTAIVNLLMRLVGFFVRAFTIAIGLIACTALFVVLCIGLVPGLILSPLLRQRTEPLPCDPQSFLGLKIAKETFIRLGIRAADIPALESDLMLRGESLREIAVSLYDLSPIFRQFLLEREATRDDLQGAVDMAVRSEEQEKERRDMFSEKKLASIPSLGTTWTYGKIPRLERYAHEVYGRASYGDRYDAPLERIEAALQKRAEGNVLLIGKDESLAFEVALAFGAKLRSGKVAHALEHKRMFIADSAILLDLALKGELEGVMGEIAAEVAHAGNIILVLPHLPELADRSTSHGASIMPLLDEILARAHVHLIALSGETAFHQSLETDRAFLERVEKIEIAEPTKAELLSAAAAPLSRIESRLGVFFTYQALRSAIDAAERYHPERLKDAFEDILEGAAREAQRSTRTLVYPKDVEERMRQETGETSFDAEGGNEALLHLEEALSKRVVGQEAALHAVSDAMRRLKAGMASGTRPVASFLFLGPTGIGKTETAKALALSYFGDESKMIRFDMSEYAGGDALWKLAGSVATGEPGLLSSTARERLSGVMLFDEIEKASIAVRDLFLQILDEGYFSDARGERVNMRNFIIICTSNAQGKDAESLRASGTFRPEFLNRFDGLIFFNALREEQGRQIVGMALRDFAAKMRAEKSIDIEFGDEVATELSRGVDWAGFGARNVRRLVQDKVESWLSVQILQGSAKPGSKIRYTIGQS